MHGEKQNSIGYKHGDPVQIPEGFQFDRTRTWEKLEEKLVLQNRRKNTAWFYAAAMFLLISVTALFFDWSDETPSLGHLNPPIVLKQAISQKSTTKLNLSDDAINYVKDPNPHFHQNKKALTVAKQEYLVVETHGIVIPLQPSITRLNIVPQDTSHAIVSSKPRMKIAHINELEQETAPPPEPSKSSIALFKKNKPGVLDEEPLSGDEKILARKPQKKFFSLISSSQ